MTSVLAELGKSLATRWLAGVLPTGLIYLAAVAVGISLGHAHWYDIPVAVHRTDGWAATTRDHPVAEGLAVAAAVALAAVGAGLLVQALGTVVDQLWSGPWPRPLHRLGTALLARRLARWEAVDRQVREAWRREAVSRAGRQNDPAASSLREAARLTAERDRICLVRPDRPTWVSDRVRAVDERVHTAYGLDLGAVWPRIWLLMSADERGEMRSERQAYDTATRLVAWAVLYLLLGLWWWPSLAVAAVLLALGVRRGRAAMDTFCLLVESAVDLHCRGLAAQLGLACEERLPVPLGRRITQMLRKDG
ncbi:hypothetical protein [Streptomyces sp. NPDC004658]|uniref:hypothetical protein n=1 Tax=Streptomyces sp. NPDC004658 TaxID=3154672 RepID=UPI0033B2622C